MLLQGAISNDGHASTCHAFSIVVTFHDVGTRRQLLDHSRFNLEVRDIALFGEGDSLFLIFIPGGCFAMLRGACLVQAV
jgi:hypothetical protein